MTGVCECWVIMMGVCVQQALGSSAHPHPGSGGIQGLSLHPNLTLGRHH